MNAEYEATRRFYLAMGFAPLQELPNPCLVLVKHLCR